MCGCLQARIVVVVTTEKRHLRRRHYSTRLTMAGRLACDHHGYLCLVPVNSSVSSVRHALLPVRDLLRASTHDHQQASTMSTRMSEFNNEPVVTVSRSATTDRHR